jgi:acyl carrier protein
MAADALGAAPERVMLGGMSEAWTVSSLGEKISEILRDDLLSVGPEFSSESNLIESGLDSLTLTQLLLAIEEATGVWVDESLLTPEILETSNSLAVCVHELLDRG